MMRRSTRIGFSLLELLLTLALAVMLMSMVGTAISFYAVKLDARDTEVRRVQLAQSILDMISDDLRCALYPPKFDDAALASLLAASAGGGGGGSTPGEGEDLSAAGLDDMSGDEEPAADASESLETVETTDLSAATTATSRPGLLGNQTQIQFDVSRLPRIEEYRAQLVGDTLAEMTDVPSDIKTVTYYLQGPGGGVNDPLQISGIQAGSSAAGGSSAGLVRRSLDRAITLWAMQNGGTISLNATGDLLATEVVGLQFAYWDGTLWQTYWDSDASEGLPLAVRVTLTMAEASSEDSAANSTAPATRTYQQIIRLPMGRPAATASTPGISAAGL